ncbi:histidinol phosphate aminotransferase [Marinimicrobium koreense]|uniref:Histidinol-phosphate aminotransferase n=1 Tax=Marinimicrobium koreense TaxID=306545 RepID=A0A3N1NXP8_9GAMM|nr:histidinol-phosphate transaminase [Marinimicrobium koreense]ROQ20985.1 histidinol phosphate aminotransferase [Marinimicrobium koreense]
MSRFWSERVRELEPYVPGEQPKIDGLIKLNTNESPFPPSPRVRDVLTDGAIDKLRLYPDPNSSALKQTIADYYGLKPEQTFVGNGSDEVLAFAFMAFFQQPRPLLYPDITYSFYPVYCQLFDIDYEMLPLADDLSINLADYRRENGGIIFPNPNAPTGRALPLSDIEALLKENTDSVVLIDEAYVDFGAESAAQLVDRYPNLLVTQTLSKSRSLAGLRLGFALGSAELIEGLERVKNSFNSYPVDRLAEAAAIVAIEDDDYFRQCRDQVIATREWTEARLQELGFQTVPSAANFVFARVPEGEDAAELSRQLRDARIIVRYFNKPRLSEYLRISIGSDTEMQALITALKAILS